MNTEERLEVEVKVRVASLPFYRDKLISLGAETLSPRLLERNRVFDLPGGNLEKRGVLLRLRQAGHRCILTMKLPIVGESHYKVREETETDVAAAAAMEKILLGIGFIACFTYEKYRESFCLDGVQVLLDETPIGDFLELEGAPPAIDDAAVRLGFSRQDYITDSYFQLFLRSGRTGNMVFAP